jgi:hypothetical protein
MILTRWNYTKEEWNRFIHWKARKKGILFFLAGKLIPWRNRIPEISIMADRICVNNSQEPFRDQQRQIREIQIREAGNINILEISYELGNAIRGIRVPIPRGKLREAFEVQERLTMNNILIS